MGFNIGKAVAGAISGGASGGWAGAGIGAALGGFSGDEAASATSAYNRQLNDSIMLWNMQNAYNTPLQQRKRLEEAGYNPNLWYTQGNTGNSGSISQPTLSYTQGGSSSLQNLLSRLSVKSAKADVSGKEIDNEYKQLQLDYLKEKIRAIRSGKVGSDARRLLPIEKQRANLLAMTTAERRDYWNNQRLQNELRQLSLQNARENRETKNFNNSFTGRALKFLGSIF